ncbi:response regulator transcription factor [Marinobacter lacisalsi]|uniref:Response regulator transcription factor n=1 Tax=Marinobacter lacisalsi TaxID=475979 RepID=A0ABV8QPS0_9GAMM
MNVSKPAVAVIEDNEDLQEELVFFLENRGYSAWGVNSAEAFWKQLHVQGTDIVLVDISLPGENGFRVVEYLRQMDRHGLIIVSARGDQESSSKGLELGADLYLVKPISFPHLLSSIESLWHRMVKHNDAAAGDNARNPVRAGQWKVDPVANTLVAPSGSTIRLSHQEYALMAILLQSPDVVMSKESLGEQMFRHDNEPDGHRIDVIMSRLRKKAREQKLRLPINAIFGKGLVFVSNGA